MTPLRAFRKEYSVAQAVSEALTTGPTPGKGRLRLLGEMVALAGIYLVTARLGLLMAQPGTNATAVWLPTGIAMAAVLRRGPKVWPGIFIGSLSINTWLLHGLGLSAQACVFAALAAAAGNSIEAVLAGFLIARFTGTRNPFGRSKDVVHFIFFGALLSTALSALVGVSALCAAIGRWEIFSPSWLTWWLGDATGALLVTPLVMTFGQWGPGGRASRRRLEFLLFAAATSALWYVSFFKTPALTVVFIPWIALMALRLGLFFSSANVLLLAGLATWGTLQGAAPFAAETLQQSLLHQQGFIGCIAIATLVLSSTVGEMEGERRRLRDAYKFELEIFERSKMGMALCTMEGRLVDVNPGYAALLGRTVEETLSLTFSDITPKEYMGQEEAQLASLHQTGRYGPYEKEYLRKDGTRVPVRLSGLLVERRGKPYIWSIIDDISDRKRAEEQARVSQLHLGYLTKYANDFIILLDDDFRFLETNERVAEHYGYTREELIGMHATQLRTAEASVFFDEQIEPDPLTGRAVYETVHQRKDGTKFPVEISLRAIEIDGKKFYQAIIRDITDRKRDEEAQRESERKYRELVESANSIILRWTPDGRITFLNEFGQRFFGYTEEEICGRHVVGTIVPETDSSGRDLRPLMEEICANPTAFEQNVNENMRRNGERVWIAWTNKIVHGRAGPGGRKS